MNNPYFAKATKGLTSLFCIVALTLAPACTKHQEKATVKNEDVNTMIEIDNAVFEAEEDIEVKKSISKF